MRPDINTLVYSQHAVHETLRDPRSLLSAIGLILSMTLPLVILKWVTDGLVARQEQDLLKSPSAIEIQIGATGKSGPVTPELEQRLLANPGIESVIPDTTKVVDLINASNGHELNGVTVRCTQPGDPLLRFYQADLLSADERGIVLNQYAAEQLQLALVTSPDQPPQLVPGQQVTLRVTRQEGHQTTDATVALSVRAMAPMGQAASIAYLPRRVIRRVDDFQQGQSVDEYDWPGFTRSAPVGHAGYLSFSKRPFSAFDEIKLKAHGLTARPLVPSRGEDEQLRLLWGQLRPHKLHVYQLTAEGADPEAEKPPLVTQSAGSVEAITDVDDIILPWNEPELMTIDDQSLALVGLTLRQRWLRSFFLNDAVPFSGADSEFGYHAPDGDPWQGAATLTLTGGQRVPLPADSSLSQVATADPPPVNQPGSLNQLKSQLRSWMLGLLDAEPVTVTARKPAVISHEPQLVFVPADLLAHLKAAGRGEVVFDPQVQQFVHVAAAPEFYQARVIAKDIHHVPAADETLREFGFATQSQRTRVEELQSYVRTLDRLVIVVAGTVLLFGMCTLMVAMAENTDRKRRSLARLRMKGVGSFGLAYMVLLRGLLIGLIAAAITVPVARTASWVLTRYEVACPVSLEVLIAVAVIAAGGCLIGVLLPAIMASIMSPADALRSGAR